jgi:hypothetical protein
MCWKPNHLSPHFPSPSAAAWQQNTHYDYATSIAGLALPVLPLDFPVQLAAAPLPVGETGVASASRGGSPGLHGHVGEEDRGYGLRARGAEPRRLRLPHKRNRLTLGYMRITKALETALAAATENRAEPVRMMWPTAGNPAGWLSFSTFVEWQAFVTGLDLTRTVPEIVAAKFERAQKLYLLAWLDFDLIKAGELTALTTLELALKDRYGGKVPRKRRKDGEIEIKFADLLAYLPDKDGLTDDKLPMIQRCGGTAIGFLNGKNRPTLAETRNKLAHGYPFESGPIGGLLELVRDLIDYAYRDWPLTKG